ncbi:hypothetical protein HMPREF9622_00666 [Cutibacterium modestum HL037PA3]|nr:hypothetical protein HMPREF9622_00666 [Cutibacterium modestum HL037PA3]EGG27356.1 hypothetical protein PA08_0622 [Cutibacterium modestum P08]
MLCCRGYLVKGLVVTNAVSIVAKVDPWSSGHFVEKVVDDR